MTTLPVLDLTNHFVTEFKKLESQVAQLSSENDELRTRPAPQATKTAPDVERRLAAALAEVAALQKSLASEQAALAKANLQIGETSRVVAGLRTELNAAVLKGCPHCDQLREQLKSHQSELQMAKSDQQTLQDRTRQWESLNLLRQQNQVLRQEKDEATARLKECEKFRLKVEMDRLKQMNQ